VLDPTAKAYAPHKCAQAAFWVYVL
jgi:hypothetical protein